MQPTPVANKTTRTNRMGPRAMALPKVMLTTVGLRYHLMNDQNAASLFYGSSCQLCSDANWIALRKDIP